MSIAIILGSGSNQKVLDELVSRNITTIAISQAISDIGDHAFDSCTKLAETLTIPSTVDRIGKAAFRNCPLLTKVRFISSDKMTIDEAAFQGCSGVTVFDFAEWLVVPTLLSASAFADTGTAEIWISRGLYNAWSTSENWSAIADRLVGK